ncbi:TIGR00153 family protein [Thermococcus barophilus]|uniref:Phosphate transport regulator n=1 Tax=Thermococcus barophilus (strain DSM 11836 / MP) TaxID=391623 RepID=F0LIU3_THEBM|nr:TIGR00153 family protein [Thermococcus barophilus]ADT84545.1 phosphate transport regulator [Thermococcus barophilus MP]
MPIFGGKESNVFEAINRHLEMVGLTLEKLNEMIRIYLEGDFEKAEDLMREVENYEREADTLRREIETMLYQGAFLPANRGDYVRLSELIDNTADAAESAAHVLILAKPKVPKELKEEIMQLVDASLKTYEYVRKAVELLNEDVNEALEYAKKTEEQEENADKLEYDILKKMFESEKITTYAKLIWNQVITKIGDIADRAEDASDQVMLMAIKRRG